MSISRKAFPLSSKNKSKGIIILIKYADIVVGLVYGDEGKGCVASYLSSDNHYQAVARWAGGNNAGHTVYVDGKKYKTHLIPSGVFYGKLSIIGPGCVLHPESFFEEIRYLEENGFDTSLVKVSPRTHIVQAEHIEQDKAKLAAKLGTTSKGIAPVYAAKAARVGVLAKDVLPVEFLWDEDLSGAILCEGAQGFYLDQDYGNYPYVTSSVTLPYGACSLGFPPQLVREVYGLCKAYDTRSGEDPFFPELDEVEPILREIAEIGNEFGVTTGRPRKVRWLDLDMLVKAVNISGTTILVMNKCDVLEKVESTGLLKYKYQGCERNVETVECMKGEVTEIIREHCPLVSEIIYSTSPEDISGERKVLFR